MTVVSNQYAAKTFSEHPIASWPLDDDVSYISLLSEAQRDLTDTTYWTPTLCSISDNPTLPNEPSLFPKEPHYEIVGNASSITEDGTFIVIEGNDIFSFNEINEDLQTFSISFYLYQNSIYVNYYQFGYRYWDNDLSEFKEILFTETSNNRLWKKFTATFNVTEFDSDLADIIIKINVNAGGSGSDYSFIINGLSVGQWSETTSSKSLGVVPGSLPSSASLTGLTGVPAEQYGPLSDNGYYIVEDNKLLAKNEGVPLVFGSENVTRLYPSSNENPSIIFPSKGMFSQYGFTKSYTFEFWMRIRPNVRENFKIFGPLDSPMGLYVSEGFLVMSIGNSFGTHNVSEWYRPMLVNIILNAENCFVFINGEEVISIDLQETSMQFSENDWLGFFSSEEVDIFEIDCVSIMSYELPLKVAKRRFVWGQGVGSQEFIDSSFKGTTSAIEFASAKYSVNSVYPDKERWDAGNYYNMDSTSKSIKTPNYIAPNIFLSGRTKELWCSANRLVNNIEYPSGDHPKFFTFRPGVNSSETEWIRNGPDWTEKGYLEFSRENISFPLSAMYGVFEIEDEIEESRPLIHIVNSLSGKRFEINVYDQEARYIFDGVELDSFDISALNHFVVGFHIPTLIRSYGYEISSFFSSIDAIKVYVGSAPDTISNQYETFEGKVYKVSFSDSSNYYEIQDNFNSTGFALHDEDDLFYNHYATYSAMPFEKYGCFFIDISVSSKWEEYFPLSYFSKYSKDTETNQYYGFDFLQFNIGYPSLIQRSTVTSFGDAWQNYLEIENAFRYPIQKSYEIIDNENITGYSSYNDLYANLISQTFLDTSNSSIDIFVTFQLLAEGANEPLENFPHTKELENTFIVDASLESTQSDPYKPYKTKFRVVDGTIIYPPKNIDINDIAMVVHFVINQDSIIKNPLAVRDMSITSKSLNFKEPNPIGTKFGNDIYPYIKTGIYYDYKSKNPLTIYKKDTPYFYLTEKSGIRILNFNDGEKEYGASVLINNSKKNNFYMGAAQLFIKYDAEDYFGVPMPIFEIQRQNETIEFVAETDFSGKRNIIYARNKTSKEYYNNVRFYQNGNIVNEPYLIRNEWNTIGMLFDDPLDFSNFRGAINIFAGCTFNNISYYLSEGLNEVATIVPKTWQDIWKPDGTNIVDWQYWYDENGATPIKKWKDVYVFAEDQVYTLGPQDIYKMYTGTNIDVVDDNSGINLVTDSSSVSIYSDILWSNFSGKPA